MSVMALANFWSAYILLSSTLRGEMVLFGWLIFKKRWLLLILFRANVISPSGPRCAFQVFCSQPEVRVGACGCLCPCALGLKGRFSKGLAVSGEGLRCAAHLLQQACFLAKLKISQALRTLSEGECLLLWLICSGFKRYFWALAKRKFNFRANPCALVFCKHLNVVCASWSPGCLAFPRLDGQLGWNEVSLIFVE